jgi:hypothetical protein
MEPTTALAVMIASGLASSAAMYLLQQYIGPPIRRYGARLGLKPVVLPELPDRDSAIARKAYAGTIDGAAVRVVSLETSRGGAYATRIQSSEDHVKVVGVAVEFPIPGAYLMTLTRAPRGEVQRLEKLDNFRQPNGGERLEHAFHVFGTERWWGRIGAHVTERLMELGALYDVVRISDGWLTVGNDRMDVEHADVDVSNLLDLRRLFDDAVYP